MPEVVSLATTPRALLALPKASLSKHAIAQSASHPDGAHEPGISSTPLARLEGLKSKSPVNRGDSRK
eukprot:281285-Alexandrium_andersonii.AAC.1